MQRDRNNCESLVHMQQEWDQSVNININDNMILKIILTKWGKLFEA